MAVEKFLKDHLKADIKKVLEVGVGRGEFLSTLVSVLDDTVQITGIDTSEPYVFETKKHFPQNNVELLAMSAEEMHFEDHTFDVVCISNTMHHLEHQEQVMKEMKRVLKPEGIMVIQEMVKDEQTPAQMSHVWIHHFAAEMDRYFKQFHDETYSAHNLEEIIKNYGFKIQKNFAYNVPEFTKEETKQILDSSVNSLFRRIQTIENTEDHNYFAQKLNTQKDALYHNGFALATEYVFIAALER
ncbi:MAG: class I SAM-dependent methyltransferase [Clostridia bacterium]|nr:class I SAM-dependent methyltransferase [Clostridia bacterium]